MNIQFKRIQYPLSVLGLFCGIENRYFISNVDVVVIRPKYIFIVSKLDVLVLSNVFYDLVKLYMLGEIYIKKKRGFKL